MCLPTPRGLVEKKEIELVMSKLEDAQKYLAQKYCKLVLGVGMADKHHMNCGKYACAFAATRHLFI